MEDIAKQTWEKLEEMFATKSLHNKLFLKKELHSLKIEKSASMMEHASAFNRCEGLVAKSEERGRSSKHERKKSNKGRSKLKAKDYCFECGSKDHWKKNCPA
ncbi:unnamed protein product [Prunus brigantina]